jgi:hypothetical protein
MSYYLTGPDIPIQIWQIEETEKGFAVRIGIHNLGRFEAEPGKTIWDTLRTAGFERDRFHKTALGPGEFYPRMWRPSVLRRTPRAQHEPNIAKIIAIARGQLTVLMRQLDRICQTIQPEGRNLDAFGHDIRNLLILACTEAEAHWRNVLVANGGVRDAKGMKVKENHYKTKHYVVLRDPMRLNEYAVMFPNYPWLDVFKPYENWNAGSPTCSLEWYDSYNAVKHDRETQFMRAQLRHVFDAIAACVIIMVSQFGVDEGLGEGTELRSFFHLSGVPNWPLSEFYISPYGKPPTAVCYGFKATDSQRESPAIAEI